MAVTIRLTPHIESLAKDYCERVGISLNSLVGVALDAYLQRPEQPPKVAPASAPAALQPEPATVAAAPAPGPEPVAKLEAVRRQAADKPVLTAPPRPPADPKPVLSAKPSKAERSRLAEWHRRNPGRK